MTAVIRFAFWGRVSTEDRQDPGSSRAWQLTRARALIEARGGQIVIEYFDIDKSRSIPPQRRPRAHALLVALADPNRGFEAVVVGEPQRALRADPEHQHWKAPRYRASVRYSEGSAPSSTPMGGPC